MLIANNLSKTYGKVKALNGISLQIREGELYGLLGPNGAGKTTTIGILSSLLQPDTGDIIIAGRSLSKETSLCKQMIGIVPQEIALYEDLSALENLRFWGSLYGTKGKELDRRIYENLKMLGLYERRNQRIKTYSGGMKRRINIAAALLHNPRLLFMDEPTVGIDPQSRNLIFEVIETLHRKGLTLIYTTHYMEEAERLCQRIGIIDEGRIITEGTLEELQRNSSSADTILLSLDQAEPDQLNALRNHYNGQLTVKENQLILSASSAHEQLTELVQLCDKYHLRISNLKITKTSLETIFLELTGKQLRD